MTESDDDSEVLKDLARQSSPFVESHIQILDGFSDDDVQPTPSHGRHTVPSAPSDPRQLISQGVSFLTGLAETLKSEEATRQLVDNIVEVDEKTGEVNVKIPVASKETVMQLFSLLGKLM